MSRGYVFYLALLSVLGTLAAVSFLDAGAAPLGESAKAFEANRAHAVQGLWSRWPDRQREGDPVRFYYFHGDGNGLYRYGRIGSTNTHSFDYRVDEDTLVLTFRKSGVEHQLPFRVEVRDGRRVLHLVEDPEEGGASVDYIFVPPPSAALLSTRGAPAPFDATRPAGHMWIDLQKHATGGMAFSLYQLGPAGIDGRGTGWHHRGDFDDWSTEALSYRLDDTTLELRFDLTEERFTTRYRVVAGEDGKRQLVLESDPRNWWHRAAFADMGRSFAADLAPFSRALVEETRAKELRAKGD